MYTGNTRANHKGRLRKADGGGRVPRLPRTMVRGPLHTAGEGARELIRREVDANDKRKEGRGLKRRPDATARLSLPVGSLGGVAQRERKQRAPGTGAYTYDAYIEEDKIRVCGQHRQTHFMMQGYT